LNFEAFAWMRAITAADLGATAKAVAFTLALRADSDGKCWPSSERIADDAGLSRTAARSAVAELRARNVIAVESGSRGRVSNRYELQPPAQWANRSPADTLNRSRDNRSAGNRSGGDPQPVTTQPVNRSPGDLELPKRTTQELPKVSPAAPVAPAPPVVARVVELKPDASDHAKLRAHYARAYEQALGVPHKLPKSQGGRYAKAAQELLDTYGLEGSIGIVDRALADPWQLKTGPELWQILPKAGQFRGKPTQLSPPTGAAKQSSFDVIMARVQRMEATGEGN
jgi:hypothetical protein